MRSKLGCPVSSAMYDGDGRRVAKANASQVPYKLYLYGSGGEILAETDGAGNNPNEYIFFGGKRIAMLPTGSTVQFYVEDSLGSSRIVTSSTGVLCYDADFYPYGGERPVTDTCTQNNYKFEGKERDTETGNDDFGARYYSNRFGRWLSADWSNVPVPVPYANLTNPQTLNLYSMVADDPESSADLDGHQSMTVNDPCYDRSCMQNQLNSLGIDFAALQRELENSGRAGMRQDPAQNQNNQQQTPDQLQQVTQAQAEAKQKAIADQTETATDEGRLNAAKQATQMAEPMINAGVKVVVAEAAITATVAVASSPAAAGAANAAKKNLKFDGPSPGLAYGNGRAFAIRWGKFTILRVDLHPMSPASAPQWHVHLFSEGGEHGLLRFPISW